MRTAWLAVFATIGCATVALAQDPPTEDGGAEEAGAEEAGADGVAAEEQAPSGPQNFALSVSNSWIYVVIYNDSSRWTPITGHDHGIRATSFTGSVTWDTADASACKVDIRVPYSGLRVDPPGMRERLKIPVDGAISDSQKEKVVGNMLSKGQLNQDSFGEVRFVATSCSGTTGKIDVTGNMSIRGVSKKITIPMDVSVEGDTFRASGTISLTHADFDMKPFTYGPGTPRNQEKLTFGVDVIGKAG